MTLFENKRKLIFSERYISLALKNPAITNTWLRVWEFFNRVKIESGKYEIHREMFFRKRRSNSTKIPPWSSQPTSFSHSGRSSGKNRGDDHTRVLVFLFKTSMCTRADSAIRSLSLLTCVPLSFPTPDNARRAVHKTDIKGTYRGCRIQSLATRICDLSNDLTGGGSSERVGFVRWFVWLVSENCREK